MEVLKAQTLKSLMFPLMMTTQQVISISLQVNALMTAIGLQSYLAKVVLAEFSK